MKNYVRIPIRSTTCVCVACLCAVTSQKNRFPSVSFIVRYFGR